MRAKLSPFIWFDSNALEAAEFWCATFGGHITSRFDYPDGGPGPAGSPCTIGIEIFGQSVTLLNGHSPRPFSDAVSLMVTCDDQAELDRLWSALEAGGGTPIACGWIEDRFGFRWQIVPKSMLAILEGDDAAAKARAFGAMMDMVKLDEAALLAAAGRDAA